MVEIFSNFTSTLIIVGVLLALGIIFEKQFIALEDKFDVWFAKKKKTIKTKKANKSKTNVSLKKNETPKEKIRATR